MKARKMSLKEKAVEFTQETTMHGVQYVGKEKIHWLRRMIWAVTVLGMVAVASWQIVDKFIYFYSYPTETKTTIRNKNELDFPSVTICNLNKFRRSVFGEEAPFWKVVLKSLFDPGQLTPNETISVLNNPALKERANSTTYRRDVLYPFAHQIYNMTWQVVWRGEDITANTTDYFTRVVTDEGVCFTFHSEDVKKSVGYSLNTTSTGTAGGLWLRMNVEQTFEYFFGPENSAGFKMLVHDSRKFPLVAELGFAVSPGTETFVSVKKNEVRSLPPPYEGSICRDTTDAGFKNPLTFFDTYNQPACRLECQTKYVLKECGCRIFYQPGLEDDWFCSIYDMLTCANPALENYTKSTTALADCDCFQECHTTSYEVSVSSALYPAQHILDDLKEIWDTSEEFIKKNYLEVRIFFEEMNIDSTEQKPAYEAGDLLADVGGTAGLFLGASLLTVMEMGEFLLLTATSFLQSLSGAGKVKQNNITDDSKSHYDNNISMDKSTKDKNDIFGTMFSPPRPESRKSTATVKQIRVGEYS